MNLSNSVKAFCLTAVTATMVLAAPAVAQEAAAAPNQYEYALNTLLFLIGGFLVMWMAAGFAMLEAGMVRTKNVAMQCTKNIALYSIAGIMFWLVGYNLVYPGDAWLIENYIGNPVPVTHAANLAQDTANTYSTSSDWFFQMVFCATAASIVSGTVAERIKLWPFLIFVAVLTGAIYPIVTSWEWGEGWLDDMGFSDFAGSTLVHSTGGWAALVGAIVLGPRLGKYVDGRTVPMPGSNMALATLGTFILWLGWFGFNGGSQLAFGTIEDAASASQVFVNTNMAACGGVVAAIILNQIFYGKVDLTMALNGALAGLVAITAEPLTPAIWQAVIIGAVGGVIVVFTVPLLDKLKIDDVVGAIPVHLFAGIWGTLIVSWTNTEVPIMAQVTGVVAIGIFASAVSLVVWLLLAATIGIRASEEDEMEGLDKAEIGLEAYPEFGAGSQRM